MMRHGIRRRAGRHALHALAWLLLVATASCGEPQSASDPHGAHGGPEDGSKKAEAHPVRQTPVRLATVRKQAVQETVTLVGTVEPWQRSAVASEVEGLVKNFPAKEGRQVTRGQLLAQLGTDTLLIELDAATAAHREAVTRHRQAQQDLTRIRTLSAKSLVTQKELDDAVAEERALRERLSTLDTEIRRVRDQVHKSTIVAPFDGWITQEFTEVGQWVNVGGDIIEMVAVDRVRVNVPLPERYVRHIHVDDPVRATFDGLPAFDAKGTVFSLVAQADRISRTFPVNVAIPNPSLTIKSGMASRVTFRVGQPHQGLVIPKDALVLRGSEEFVFLVKDGTAQKIPVVTITHLDGAVEVTGDLHAGMSVVAEGNERLFPGQPVRAIDPPTSSDSPTSSP